MDTSLPTALIAGMENFGAKELAIELVARGLAVIGVGDYVAGMNEYENFENRIYLKDVTEDVRYVFDFEGNEEVWEKARKNQAKLIVVQINNEEETFNTEKWEGIDWRIVRLKGVFGQGMDKNEDESINFLIKAAEAATRNKNLILPGKNKKVRLLSTKDGVEVMIRAAMMPGLSGVEMEMWGREITSEELAEKLIDLAKMTRFKVEESGEIIEYPERVEVEREWGKIRWEPVSEWNKDMEMMLQYFFTKVDEESRKPKNQNPSPLGKLGASPFHKGDFEEQKQINENRMVEEVVIESEEELRIEENEREPEKQMWKATKIVEPEADFEIEKIVIKNSNNRFVEAEKEVEEVNTTASSNPSAPTNVGAAPLDKGAKKIIFPKMGSLKWWAAGVLGIGLLWIGINVIRGVLIYQGLKQSVKLMENKEYDKAEKLVKNQYSAISNWDNEISVWGWNRYSWGRHWQEVLRLGKEVTQVEMVGMAVARGGEKVNGAMWGEKEINWNTEMESLKTNMADLGEGLGSLEARMGGDWGWVPGKWRSQMVDGKKKVANLREKVLNGVKLMGVIPEMVGADGRRRDYLILFQNENELRPSGGFIGSYGVVTFEGGRFVNMEISDIYEADGQLKGHVEPPAPIKKYLGEAGWFMRDANWQPDFREAAKEVLWFFEKETGRKVDGVMAVNLSMAKAILGVTGEIFVPDFKEKVNKDNLYEQAEFYAETKFFPGSTQKASFLGMLAKQLFEQIKTMDVKKKAELIAVTMDKAGEREVQFNMANTKAAKVMNDLGWDGAMMGGRCAPSTSSGQASSGSGCFSDYLMIVEANLGVNKANYFLYRNIEQTVELTPNMINRVVKITYENTSKNNNWPGGSYKAYTRIYIPEDSNLAEVAATDLRGGKTVYQSGDLDVASVNGKKEVGMLVEVPFGSKRVLEIRYTNLVKIGNYDKFSYLEYVQKQSGFGDTGMTMLLTVPNDWQVNQVEPAANVVGGKLLFNQKLTKDLKMGVEIGK